MEDGCEAPDSVHAADDDDENKDDFHIGSVLPLCIAPNENESDQKGSKDSLTVSTEPKLTKAEKRKLRRIESHKKWKEQRKELDKAKERARHVKIFEETGETPKQRKQFLASSLERSVDINIVFDLSFAKLMSEIDNKKLVRQLNKCYAVNRASKKPLKIHFTGLDDLMKQELHKGQPGYENWKISTQTTESYEEFFKMQVKENKLFYLTAESNCCLDSLERGSYYVIGGLVDHNSLKGHCQSLAVAKNIQTVRLPIDNFIELKTRHVLAVSHVFEVLLAREQGLSWKESLLSVIPQRKGALPKDDDKDSTHELDPKDSSESMDQLDPKDGNDSTIQELDPKNCNEPIHEWEDCKKHDLDSKTDTAKQSSIDNSNDKEQSKLNCEQKSKDEINITGKRNGFLLGDVDDSNGDCAAEQQPSKASKMFLE